jgi:hypothetical protein
MSERYMYLKNGDELVSQRMFHCEARRLKIVDKWKKLYGKRFADLSITVDPEVKKEKTDKPKASGHEYGHVFNNYKKSFNKFNGGRNGYGD